MKSRRRVGRIRPEWEQDAREVSDPADLIPLLKNCSGKGMLGFDEKGRILARMNAESRPFLSTNGVRGGNRREYRFASDVDFLTTVWLITLRWCVMGDFEHLPPLAQLAIEGNGSHG